MDVHTSSINLKYTLYTRFYIDESPSCLPSLAIVCSTNKDCWALSETLNTKRPQIEILWAKTSQILRLMHFVGEP